MEPTPAAPPSLVDALQRHLAARWPQQPVRRIETHVSWVLLQGQWAYKLKKPVRLGFLDFTSAAARRQACEEELRLNRRTAPALYVDVLPLHADATLALPGEPGHAPQNTPVDAPEGAPVLDWVLRMRRFDDGALFSERLAAGTLRAGHVDALARRLAQLHAAAAPAPPQSGWGTPEAIEAAAATLLQGLAEAALPGDAAALAAVAGWLRRQGAALHPAWAARRAAGRVREGHGDLHLGNAIALDADDGDDATAFDGIEFDPALRWIDVTSDIAFPVMDLHAHGRPDLAQRCLNAWLEHTGDYAGLAVLRWYLVYRAAVRALVTRLRARQAGAAAPDGPDHLQVALALTAPGRPCLLATHGLSGSGKTHVTQALLEAAGAVRIRSDVERKRLHGLKALEPSGSAPGGGLYSAAANEHTYAELARLASLALAAGWPTIVDAACLQRGERAGFVALAQVQQVPFALLHCHAREAVLRQRIRQRQAAGCDASEADLAVLDQQLARQQPCSPAEGACVIDVDTEQPLDAAALARRWLDGAG